MYLTAFVHREDLFDLTARWLCGRPDPEDGRLITEILICDSFVLGETLEALTRELLTMVYEEPVESRPIRFKGELRDLLCQNPMKINGRVAELIRHYRTNPDFFYRETPIHGTTYLDRDGRLVGISRIKRPRRIAEKANRYIANWIFRLVKAKAQKMAEERAREFGVPLENLVSSEEEMAREFSDAEAAITERFREGTIRLDKEPLTLHDVGGIKVVAEADRLAHLRERLSGHPLIKIANKGVHKGDYQAESVVLEVAWDRETVCRRYRDGRAWEKYFNRGIPEDRLRQGIEVFLRGALPTLHLELIFTTFADLVESELGRSIHEERIISQRDHKVYKGYIPLNVEFLMEYLFAVGLSPQAQIDGVPVKLWGRYLPDTISYHIHKLYQQPEYGIL
jgi:hypothetical protein